ncbi:hypothetical protein CAPTEDRAFT_223299 [Capitella teleta]|uniref:G protein-regulated inducer of neurite outgrowth C-terminal domain-containing protein n=1 Tax=Capitella teleta TaxID=283909 RepID=R7VD02_CAPTE|nr:hypothetical protein CAPTEDRAFT_223299 [Capitella teleta]|eukprot:ELU16688.1 hypothetical protein CAPTEDRAFT_223299 [Capitella teleta]
MATGQKGSIEILLASKKHERWEEGGEEKCVYSVGLFMPRAACVREEHTRKRRSAGGAGVWERCCCSAGICYLCEMTLLAEPASDVIAGSRPIAPPPIRRMSSVRTAMHGENSAGLEATRRRRQSFQRSTTLPVQPTLTEQDEEDDVDDEDDEHCRLIQPIEIRTHGIESPNSSVDEMERSDDDAARQSFLDVAPRPHHQQRHSAPAASEAMRPSPSKRTHLKQRSISVYNTNDSRDHQHNHHEGIKKTKLGRAPSTPSVLLSKVKERIREKVFQASTDWNAAAIVQERRQRAVESFEAKLSRKKSGEVEIEHIPMKDLHSKKKRGRMRSDPIPVVVATSSRESDDFCPCDSPQPSCSRDEGPSAARLAFRRRSISEDTYDRPLVQHPAATAAYRNSSDSGVICSSVDLKAMKTDFKKRRSPRPSKQDLRSLSVDQTKLLDSQNSMESVSSGYSAQSSVSAGKYDAEVDEGLTSDTPSEYSAQMRQPLVPRIVGGDGSQNRTVGDGGQNITLQNATLLYGSLDESTPGCQDEPLKPIPEIVFDAQGQTWDVYGAEFDPEVLGEAIQRHLVKLMLSKTDSMDSESSDKLYQSPEVMSDESDSENKSTSRNRRGVRRADSRDKVNRNANFLVRLLCLFSNRHEPEMTT